MTTSQKATLMQQTPLTDAIEWLAACEVSVVFRERKISMSWCRFIRVFSQTVPFERPEQASAALIRAVECGKVMEAKQ